jgi:hypothetical protein
MTSTSCMTGTGFMKCMPITFSGRLVRAAISVIEMDDVFEARIVSGSADSSSVWKMEYLSSAAPGPPRPRGRRRGRPLEIGLGLDAREGRVLLGSSRTPFLTCRSRFFAMVSSAWSSTSA